MIIGGKGSSQDESFTNSSVKLRTSRYSVYPIPCYFTQTLNKYNKFQ